jgi:hypothetical protein
MIAKGQPAMERMLTSHTYYESNKPTTAGSGRNVIDVVNDLIGDITNAGSQDGGNDQPDILR